MQQTPHANVYVPSSITQVIGKENLKLFKLRENGAMQRCVAVCCFTTLVGEHVGYLKSVFLVPPTAVRTGFPAPDPTPFFRCFTRSWPAEWPALPSVTFESMSGLPGLFWQFSIFAIFLRSRFVLGNYNTLFDELGPVTVLALTGGTEKSALAETKQTKIFLAVALIIVVVAVAWALL